MSLLRLSFPSSAMPGRLPPCVVLCRAIPQFTPKTFFSTAAVTSSNHIWHLRCSQNRQFSSSSCLSLFRSSLPSRASRRTKPLPETPRRHFPIPARNPVSKPGYTRPESPTGTDKAARLIIEDQRIGMNIAENSSRSARVSYALIGLLVSVYGLYTLEELFRSSEAPLPSLLGTLQKSYRDYIAQHQEYQALGVMHTWFVATPSQWLSLHGQLTLLTSSCTHTALSHLLCSAYVLNQIGKGLCNKLRPGQLLATFLIGGFVAGNLGSLLQWVRNQESPWLGQSQLVKFYQETIDRWHGLDAQIFFGGHVGSSGTLVSMITILAIAEPSLVASIPLTPISLPIRAMMLMQLAFDVGGFLTSGYWGKLPLDHGTHLGGNLTGMALYALWLRRLPQFRHLRRVNMIEKMDKMQTEVRL